MKYLFWMALGIFLMIYDFLQNPKLRTRRLNGTVTGISADGSIHVTYQDGDILYYAHFAPPQRAAKIGAPVQVPVPADCPAAPLTVMLTRSRLVQPAFALPTAGKARFFVIAGAVCITVSILGAIAQV